MDLDDDELKATRALHNIKEIRKKSVNDCNIYELKRRCIFDEQYIRKLERRILDLEHKRPAKKDKNELQKLRKEWEDR